MSAVPQTVVEVVALFNKKQKLDMEQTELLQQDFDVMDDIYTMRAERDVLALEMAKARKVRDLHRSGMDQENEELILELVKMEIEVEQMDLQFDGIDIMEMESELAEEEAKMAERRKEQKEMEMALANVILESNWDLKKIEMEVEEASDVTASLMETLRTEEEKKMVEEMIEMSIAADRSEERSTTLIEMMDKQCDHLEEENSLLAELLLDIRQRE